MISPRCSTNTGRGKQARRRATIRCTHKHECQAECTAFQWETQLSSKATDNRTCIHSIVWHKPGFSASSSVESTPTPPPHRKRFKFCNGSSRGLDRAPASPMNASSSLMAVAATATASTAAASRTLPLILILNGRVHRYLTQAKEGKHKMLVGPGKRVNAFDGHKKKLRVQAETRARKNNRSSNKLKFL
jgi:hypothetical protein